MAAPSGSIAPAGALRRRYLFLRRWLRLAGPYWNSGPKWRVRAVTAVLVALTVAQVGLAIWTNYWNRALFDALEARSMARFVAQIGVFVVIFALTIAVTALHLQVKRQLQIDWRQWLTERLLGQWMTHGSHYQLQHTAGEHDNPDGRIAEDIHVVTEVAIALAHTLLFSLLMLGSFVDILLSVSGTATVPGTALAVPGYMVVLAFVYAGVGTGLGLLLGRPLVRSTNRLQALEANFRFGLARSRENAEAIALMQGEPVERDRASRQFAELELGWNRQTLAYLGIVSFSAGYGALLPVFPILVAAPQYIAGVMTLGVLMQSAQAFQRLTSALSWPVDSLGDLARWQASAERVLSLHDDLLTLEADARASALQGDGQRIQRREGTRPELALRQLSIAEPDGRVIVEAFDATIAHGERVLIGGDATAAVALFKAVAGLWPWGQGEVLLPRGRPIYYMPQRPFVPEGTLRAALSYPLPPGSFDDAPMRDAMQCAGLGWLVPRLGESEAWGQALPPRTLQRIGFARLFLHRPAWVFMEEASSTLEPRGEDAMFRTLHERLPGATVLTIGFHAELERHHTRRIALTRAGDGKYLFRRGDLCLLEDRPTAGD
jgi:putative ATP-binding cassette transporter